MAFLLPTNQTPRKPLSRAAWLLIWRVWAFCVRRWRIHCYGFLGLRFIPQAFGAQGARGVAVVLFAILIPHVLGVYLVGHRLGFIG